MGILQVPGGPARTVLRVDRREAITAAMGEGRPGDVILLAGKGHERTQIVGQERIPFDDREVALEALGRLGYHQGGS
jgi:UDP-N-acetylmuramoyl-L-alanyl-D-glutamate--2,6-diaminopimelate ligase